MSKYLSFTQQLQMGCRNAASFCHPSALGKEDVQLITSCDMEIAGVSTLTL